MLRPADLIERKRDGGELTGAEIEELVLAHARGGVPDEQMAAFLMAVYFRGLTPRETFALTDAMVRSGETLDLSSLRRVVVDKHSTGGVGDKVTIVLGPVVAACGVPFAKLSGRGLGHTGGTLDKLESIPGFRVDLDVERFAAQVGQLGVCLIGQTERVAPADRRLYALRDVTGTIESIPLIASSIMSKKLAEGIDALVLDCKVGAGAFMKDATRARALCAAIRAIGHAAGKAVTCVLTDMDAPIGHAVGNALEIAESIDVLSGGGPADTRELTVVLGGEMLLLAGVARTADEGQARIAHALDDGSALAVFRRVVAAQGGDPTVCDRPGEVLPRARHQWPVRAPRDGAIAAIDAEDVGMAALVLGAGRRTKDDVIDPAAGVVLACGLGDRVTAGQPLATLHANLAEDDPRVAAATARFLGAIHLADDAPPPRATRVLETLR